MMKCRRTAVAALAVLGVLTIGCTTSYKIDSPPTYVPPLRGAAGPLSVAAITVAPAAAAKKPSRTQLRGLRVFSRMSLQPSLAQLLGDDISRFLETRTHVDAGSPVQLIVRISKAEVMYTDATPLGAEGVTALFLSKARYIAETDVSIEMLRDGKSIGACRFDQPVEITASGPFSNSQTIAAVEQLLRKLRPGVMTEWVQSCEPLLLSAT